MSASHVHRYAEEQVGDLKLQSATRFLVDPGVPRFVRHSDVVIIVSGKNAFKDSRSHNVMHETLFMVVEALTSWSAARLEEVTTLLEAFAEAFYNTAAAMDTGLSLMVHSAFAALHPETTVAVDDDVSAAARLSTFLTQVWGRR